MAIYSIILFYSAWNYETGTTGTGNTGTGTTGTCTTGTSFLIIEDTDIQFITFSLENDRTDETNHWVERWILSNLSLRGRLLLIGEDTYYFWRGFCSDVNPMTTEEKLTSNWTFADSHSLLWAIFDRLCGSGRHFSIDTWFALDIFAKLWLTLPRPWHVAELFCFSHIEEFRWGSLLHTL